MRILAEYNAGDSDRLVRAEVNNHFVMATRVLVNRDRCGLYIPLKVSTVGSDQRIYIVVFYSYLMQLVWWPLKIRQLYLWKLEDTRSYQILKVRRDFFSIFTWV